MMDEDNDDGPCLSCNLCARPLSTMYKTACNHLFCIPCAESHFSKDPHCPADRCGMKLTQKHFSPTIDVGINAPESVEAALYKNIFSSGNLEHVIGTALNAIPALENVLALISSQLYLELNRAQRGHAEADGKYKSLRKSYKGMEKDYRSKLVSMQKEIDDAGAVQHKLKHDMDVLRNKCEELMRKNKSMEQVLTKLRADGHNVPPFAFTPVRTPPPQFNQQQPPAAITYPSPRSVSRGGHGQPHHPHGGGGGTYYQQHPQHPQQQHHHHLMPQPAQYNHRSPSASPRHASRPHSYGGGGGHHHGHMPETPSSTSHFRRGGSAGQQSIMLGGGGGLASRLSPHRNAAVVTSSSSSGPYGGGGGYPREPSPKAGYGLPMRY